MYEFSKINTNFISFKLDSFQTIIKLKKKINTSMRMYTTSLKRLTYKFSSLLLDTLLPASQCSDCFPKAIVMVDDSFSNGCKDNIHNLVNISSFLVCMLDCYCCQRLSQSQNDITCVIRFDANLLNNLNVPTFKLHCNI